MTCARLTTRGRMRDPRTRTPWTEAMMTRGRRNRIEDIWTYVDKRGPNACWSWTGSLVVRTGRPRFHMDRQEYVAARLILELKLGRPLAEGMWALHTCDNEVCVNPAHLYEGDHLQNMADMVTRGRQAKRHPLAQKIPQHRITEVINRYRVGEKQKDLADEFGVHQSAISMIVNGRRRA